MIAQSMEGGRFRQRLHFAVEAESAFAESAVESSQKRFPKAMAKDTTGRKKETFGTRSSASHRGRCHRRARRNAGADADADSAPRYAAPRGSRCGRRAVWDRRLFQAKWPRQCGTGWCRSFRVLKCQASDLRRQCKYDVEIRHGQKLGLALCQPARASLGLALGTVPVPARVI